LGAHIKDDEMGGSYSMYEGEKKFIVGFGGEPEGKRPLERPRFRQNNKIRMYIKKYYTVLDYTVLS